MSDDLGLLPSLVALGRATRRTIAQNIALSLAVKAAVLGLALAGYGTLWAAIAADMGASLLVIGNGMRLLGRKA
jgi:Cd2+/Zn2+-exporting ATPase